MGTYFQGQFLFWVSMKFDSLVFIGRFQPFHVGHAFVVSQAFEYTNHVIVLIGSSNRPRSFKNPFSFEERRTMIEACVVPKSGQTLTCLPLPDAIYNEQRWLQMTQRAVFEVTQAQNIGLIGHDKDDSSYYLRLFPTWGYCEVANFDNLSATPIRKDFFAHDFDEFLTIWQDKLLLPVQAFLADFRRTVAYEYLVKEQTYLADYKAAFDDLAYPPIFQTVDALIVQAGHILLIRRGEGYGAGLLALAGGFVNAGEALQQAVVREVLEETGLDLSKHTPKTQRLFDDPKRSLRGHTITQVFLYELTDERLPMLVAGDDADEAIWLPLGKLDGTELFEDHYGIICAMLGVT